VARPGTALTHRTLALAVDAVSWRVALQAVSAGGFTGWTRPTALVSPFPSLTHVAFARLFEPFGSGPANGYEVRYFDSDANRMAGGNPLTYRSDVPPWGELFDSPRHGVAAKAVNYVSSPRAVLAEFDAVAAEALESSRDVMLMYIGATDGVAHLYEDDGLVEVMLALDIRLAELQEQHRSRRGGPLRVVLFSDHGCGRAPVRYAESLRRLLGEAGLAVVERLDGPGDIVAPMFGIVNYGALFAGSPGAAASAAQAAASHPAVDLSAYAEEGGVIVLTCQGRARIEQREGPDGRWFRYAPSGADVLACADAARRLAETGRVDANGFAHEDDWFELTWQGSYPDPLRRLVDALTGDRVASRADVLLSLDPGRSWGWRSAYAGSRFRGGLKGTHGGLDRGSSLGFLMVNEDGADLPRAVPAHRALRGLIGDPRPSASQR
jgi:hypothetical protein